MQVGPGRRPGRDIIPPVVRGNPVQLPNPVDSGARNSGLRHVTISHGLDQMPITPGKSLAPQHMANTLLKSQYQNGVRQQLRSQPIVVMQPVQHRNRHKPAARRLRISQRRIRIRYPVQSLMHSAVVVPAAEYAQECSFGSWSSGGRGLLPLWQAAASFFSPGMHKVGKRSNVRS